MDFIDWMHETHRMAGQLLQAVLVTAEADDREACARAAREAALFYLRRYLEAAGDQTETADESVACLLEAAVRHDHYFGRLRAEAHLLDVGVQSTASAEDIADALMEIRFLAVGRAANVCGHPTTFREPLPHLAWLAVHATTVERAAGIFAEHALYSFNECLRRGLLSGEPIGVRYLHDPRRCADFVGFGIVNNYHAGEKVANSQRKGWLDEGLEEDYQPSVRLFFPRAEIESLPGFDSDGLHQFLVRDQVSLDLMVCAVFPTADAKDAALGQVATPERRARLTACCLVAPPECCGDPESYTTVTNELVTEQAGA